MPIHRFTALLLVALAAIPHPHAAGADGFAINKRSRVADEDGAVKVVTQPESWKPAQTAVIVCDMWDSHHCYNAVQRVKELAPRMNALLKHARGAGAIIIHAPSGCMSFYDRHEARQRAKAAPAAGNLPKDIGKWCYWKNDTEEKTGYPIDHSQGGEDDDPEVHAKWAQELKDAGRDPRRPWTRQIDTLDIDPAGDYISDSGVEIWNIMEQRGIRNVMLVGVHTNMCVLGRPFGLRNMARFGKNVVLVRDLTDAMYDPRRAPYVSHYRGTELVVEHIERHVCPTITSNQVLGGEPFAFKGAKAPRIVIAVAEKEYDTKLFLPQFAKAFLTNGRGDDVRILFEDENEPNRIVGLGSALSDCDLLLLSVRRRALPEADLAALRAYLESGKPLVAVRTSSHAFHTRGKHPDGHAEWQTFDKDVLGCTYNNHYGNKLTATISLADGAAKHAILEGAAEVLAKQPASGVSLYRSAPLAKTATPLLYGAVEGQAAEPVAWTNTYGKSRVFYTSLCEFTQPWFVVMLSNGIDWSLDRPTNANDDAAKP